jgi:C-terminal processing protease CtpA/Prc
LKDLYNRKENTTEEYWTQPDVPGEKFIGKPAFVLTSARTFSAAEEFSYDLKNLRQPKHLRFHSYELLSQSSYS